MRKAVDFLPSGYRAQRRRRGLPWSTFVVAGVVTLGIAGGSFGQFLYGKRIDVGMQEALAEKALVDADLARLAEQRAERDRLEALVRRTYLTHCPRHVPAFLAELSRSLPANCRMLEVLRVDGEQAASRPTYAPPAPAAAAGASPSPTLIPAIMRDRDRLRRTGAFADMETWVASGVSTDVASLHRFVETLDRSSLGLSAQLTSFEAAQGQAEAVRFSLTIQRSRTIPAPPPNPAATTSRRVPTHGLATNERTALQETPE